MITEIANKIIKSLKQGNKLLVCGNGGSAEMASHFVAELVNKYQRERQPLAALSLTSDHAVITAIANDFSFDYIFSKQIEALGKAGDVLILLTTSGESTNIKEAARAAETMGIETIYFPTNIETGASTPQTQEVHLRMIHEISRIVEDAFL